LFNNIQYYVKQIEDQSILSKFNKDCLPLLPETIKNPAIRILIKNQIKNSGKSFLFEVKVVILQPEKWKDKQLNVTQICI
jgi:hypothetical protein